MSYSIMPSRRLDACTIFGMCALLFLALAGHAGARTLAEVKSLGSISMCANKDALPYASNKPETPGFQIEIGRAIAEGLGVPLSIEWILPRRRANVVNCDMLLDNINDPEVNEGRMRLSRPYQKSGLALGLRQDSDSISDFTELKKGQKIGVMINSYAAMVLGKAGKSISPYAFQSDMVEDLQKGDLFGAAVSMPTMSYYILQHPDSGLRLVNAFDGVPQLTWEVAVGLRKSDPALVDAVNEILGKLIADGTLTRIYAKYGVEHRLP
ncbi:MAG TPA: transporter substrate-binding domain-containing protein [Burkholderiales bacterium]|nr:transporter substrate-binding domain-containing protein [Burkholderiales bacterium]